MKNRPFNIVSKKGDAGMTSLYCGARVSKDDMRIEACGALDELCAWCGLVKAMFRQKRYKNLFSALQRDILLICTEVAVSPAAGAARKQKMVFERVAFLEGQIAAYAKNIAVRKKCFYLPGETVQTAVLDLCRATCRRAERRLVTLRKKKLFTNKCVFVYLNRLSDLLYLLIRHLEGTHQAS